MAVGPALVSAIVDAPCEARHHQMVMAAEVNIKLEALVVCKKGVLSSIHVETTVLNQSSQYSSDPGSGSFSCEM